ncbi:hypothetical protein V8F33_002252 [Rhypophila sp. PSN 637]
MNSTRITKGTALVGIVYLLRLVQLTTLSITCFGGCYLIWMHNHHYCAYWPCSGTSREGLATVPLGEVVFVTCCVLQSLEWICYTSLSLIKLSRGKRIDSATEFCCTWTTLLLFTIGLGWFTSIKDVRATWPYCEDIGVTRFGNYYPVETNMCIVTQSAVTTGLINWIASALLAIIASWEIRKDLLMGRIKLPVGARSAEDSDAPGYQHVADESRRDAGSNEDGDRLSVMGVDSAAST